MAAKAFLKGNSGLLYDYLLREDKRLASFDSTEFFHWDQKNCPFMPSELAANGFYSLKKGAHCRCILCSSEIVDWDMGSKDWITVHSKYGCPMLDNNGLGYGNITEKICAILRDSNLTLLDLFPSYDECEYHIYSLRENRSMSLSNCRQEEIAKRKEMLADAGFFYDGISDHLVCYNCGYGVYDWTTQELESPVKTHHKLTPECTDKRKLCVYRKREINIFNNVWDYMPFIEYIMELGLNYENTRKLTNNFFMRTGRLPATRMEVCLYCWLNGFNVSEDKCVFRPPNES